MTCVICGASVVDAFACSPCVQTVIDMVTNAGITTDDRACLLDELDLVMSRQSRSAERVGGRSPDKPLPFDGRASAAHTALAHVLDRWARVYGMEGGSGAPRRAAFYLVAYMRLGSKPDILWLHVELKHAIDVATSVIDIPSKRTYVGVCSALTSSGNCSAELYAEELAQEVTCRTCQAVHSVDTRRDVMMAAVEDVLATPTEIARAVQLFGQPIRRGLIYQWVHRGRIEAAGHAANGARLYRIGDVLNLVHESTVGASGLTSKPLSDTMP